MGKKEEMHRKGNKNRRKKERKNSTMYQLNKHEPKKIENRMKKKIYIYIGYLNVSTPAIPTQILFCTSTAIRLGKSCQWSVKWKATENESCLGRPVNRLLCLVVSHLTWHQHCILYTSFPSDFTYFQPLTSSSQLRRSFNTNDLWEMFVRVIHT